MADFVYNEGAESLQDGSIDWAADTIKARAIASAATPDKDDANLATGYTSIGTDQTLANKSRTKDTTNDRIKYDADDVVFAAVAAGSTIGWIIIYKDDGGNGVPICALDVTNTPTNGGDITVQFSANGIFYSQQ